MHSSLSIAMMTCVLLGGRENGVVTAVSASTACVPAPSAFPPSGDDPDGDIDDTAGRWGDSAASTACTAASTTLHSLDMSTFSSTAAQASAALPRGRFSFSLSSSMHGATAARFRSGSGSRTGDPSAATSALVAFFGDRGVHHDGDVVPALALALGVCDGRGGWRFVAVVLVVAAGVPPGAAATTTSPVMSMTLFDAL